VRKSILVAVALPVTVSAIILLLLLAWPKTPAKQGLETPEGPRLEANRTDPAQPQAASGPAAAPEGDADSPRLLRSPFHDPAQVTKLSGAWSETDKGGVRTVLEPGTSTDVAMVELRFYRRDAAGKMEPLPVARFFTFEWVNGKRKHVHEYENRGASVGGTGFRTSAAPRNTPGRGQWWFGKTYFLSLETEQRQPNGEATVYEVLITIPEMIPKGHVWQIPVLVGQPGVTLSKSSPELGRIEGVVKEPFPTRDAKLEVDYGGTREDERRQELKADGSFAVKAKELSGMLRITEPARSGVGWMYIHSVQKRKLELPADADLVVKKEDLLTFDVPVAKDKATADLVGLAIKVHPEDVFPMSWQIVEEGAPLKKLTDEGLVTTTFIPGTYYFTALYWPKGGKWETRREEVLGRIVITKDSGGKTLEVQPLTDEEKQRIPKPAPASGKASGRQEPPQPEPPAPAASSVTPDGAGAPSAISEQDAAYVRRMWHVYVDTFTRGATKLPALDVDLLRRVAKTQEPSQTQQDSWVLLGYIEDSTQLPFLVEVARQWGTKEGWPALAWAIGKLIKTPEDEKTLRPLLDDEKLFPGLIRALLKTKDPELLKRVFGEKNAENALVAQDVMYFIQQRRLACVVDDPVIVEPFLKAQVRRVRTRNGWYPEEVILAGDIGYPWCVGLLMEVIQSAPRQPDEASRSVNLLSRGEALVALQSLTKQNFGVDPMKNPETFPETAVDKAKAWWAENSKDPKYHLPSQKPAQPAPGAAASSAPSPAASTGTAARAE
jgi:hypothetical protein